MFFKFFQEIFSFVAKTQILCYILNRITFTKGLAFMKKLLAMLLASSVLLLFGACSAKNEYALKIEGAEIGSEVFAYYLDKAVAAPERYGLKKNASASELKKAAVNECKRYIAINTDFKKSGKPLTSAQKVEISESVNDIWLRYENHYNKIGVSKQTLNKIITAEKYEEAVFTSLYDKGTGNAVAEKKLQDYFYTNYVSFRTVCVYFTSANGEPLSQLEKNEMLAVFDSLAAEKASTPEAFTQGFLDEGYSASDTVILKKNSDGYPEGFFDAVYKQADATVQIIVYDDCVFAVYKENLRDKGESVFAAYRSVCINDIYSAENEKRINLLVSDLKVEENSKVIDGIYKKVTE